ncbi:MAG: glycosyltransferase [Thermoguttaceae bacterium]|jgi:glycosyltransferase involved in cell wall biosynthesis
MRILLCHNYYQQPGGEDQSFAAEAGMLESRGHEVLRYTLHNDAIGQMGRLAVAARTLWNRQSYRRLRDLIRAHRPAVMHCTNTFPLISPSAYSAARAEGVPVVQSIRNYRLFCANAYFLRDARVCEDCLGKLLAWPAVLHRCYRGSRAATAVVVAMQAGHRLARTWSRCVDRYFAPTEFARQKCVAGGLPPDRIAVKPNFIDPDPGRGAAAGGYAVFAGRLSPEKGIDTLLAAWEHFAPNMPLRIVGDGPMAPQVRETALRLPQIEWLGRRTPDDLLAIVGEATCLLVPSLLYETFGRTIIEAYAKGTPVIASRLGAMAELVADGRTGLLFEPGNPSDLAAKVRQIAADSPARRRMRDQARREFESKYTVRQNYAMLMKIYADAAAVRGGRLPEAILAKATP